MMVYSIGNVFSSSKPQSNSRYACSGSVYAMMVYSIGNIFSSSKPQSNSRYACLGSVYAMMVYSIGNVFSSSKPQSNSQYLGLNNILGNIIMQRRMEKCLALILDIWQSFICPLLNPMCPPLEFVLHPPTIHAPPPPP